jgi:phosphoribosylformylglycinamidine synthase
VAEAVSFVRQLVRDGMVSAAHDVSDGGLGCALAEMAIAGRVGIDVDLDPLVELRGGSGETCLFGEGPGGVILAVAELPAAEVLWAAEHAGVDAIDLGFAAGDRLSISAAEQDLSVALVDAERAWRSLAETL